MIGKDKKRRHFVISTVETVAYARLAEECGKSDFVAEDGLGSHFKNSTNNF